jgi:hypothetical protein
MKFNNFNKIFGLCVAILSLTSCATSFKTVYIEVAKPSEELLPNNIISLTLMNRSMTDQFHNFSADSLQHYFYQAGFDVNASVLDSAAADTTLKALGEMLYESGRYDVVIPKNRNIPLYQTYYKVPPRLDWDYVRQICTEFNTDALLVLERYINMIKTNYENYSSSFGDMHVARIDSKYDAFVRIYDPSKEQIIEQVVVDDTIYWAEQDQSMKNLFTRKLVPVKKALIETGIKAAMDLDSKLSPQWHTEARGYFAIKDENSSKLESEIKNNNWQEAYDYWHQMLTNANSKSLKSKLEYNLAVASEMIGDIDGAAEWATKSYKTQYRQQTDNYLLQLKQRVKLLNEFKKYEN